VRRTAFLVILVSLLVIAAACGGGEEATPAPTLTGAAPTGTIPTTAQTTGEASFELLDYNVYIDESGDLIIAGIIENTGDAASRPDYDALQLVDAGGEVVATPYPTTLELIAPGQKSPLIAEIYEHEGVPQNWQELDVILQEEGYPADLIFDVYITLDPEGLASEAFESDTEGQPDLFGVSGWIINNGDYPIARPTVFVAGYDAQGKLIDVDSSYPAPDYLDPGMNMPFTSSLSMVETITNYEVFAEGEVVESRDLVELEVAYYSMVGPDKYGRTHFLGEVVNQGSELAVETEIIMALVSEQEVVVDIDYVHSSSISLNPGDSLPFMLTSTPCPARQEMWDEPVFMVQGFTEDSMSNTHVAVYSDIEVEGMDSLYKPYTTLPGFASEGQVTNTGQAEADIGIIGAIYDAEGKVVDVAYAYGLMFVGPGETEDVELRFSLAEEAADFKVFYGALTNRY